MGTESIQEFKDRPDKGEGSDHDSMRTLSSCTKKLSDDGYITQFRAISKGLESLETHDVFSPEEVKIINFYRFEGESDPDNNAILYVIETHNGEKGTLTDAYGVYNDQKVSEFIKKVDEIRKADTNPPIDGNPEDQEVS